MTSRTSTSHDKWVIEELRRDPAFAESYLETALEENDPHVFMMVLRHLAEARGIPTLIGLEVDSDPSGQLQNNYNMPTAPGIWRW